MARQKIRIREQSSLLWNPARPVRVELIKPFINNPQVKTPRDFSFGRMNTKIDFFNRPKNNIVKKTRVVNIMNLTPLNNIKPSKFIVVNNPKPVYPVNNNNKIPKKKMNYFQAMGKYKINPYGDIDKDGVMNLFDCKPFDKNKQEETPGPLTPAKRNSIERKDTEYAMKIKEAVVRGEQFGKYYTAEERTAALRKEKEMEMAKRKSKKPLAYQTLERTVSQPLPDITYLSRQGRENKADAVITRPDGSNISFEAKTSSKSTPILESPLTETPPGNYDINYSARRASQPNEKLINYYKLGTGQVMEQKPEMEKKQEEDKPIKVGGYEFFKSIVGPTVAEGVREGLKDFKQPRQRQQKIIFAVQGGAGEKQKSATQIREEERTKRVESRERRAQTEAQGDIQKLEKKKEIAVVKGLTGQKKITVKRQTFVEADTLYDYAKSIPSPSATVAPIVDVVITPTQAQALTMREERKGPSVAQQKLDTRLSQLQKESEMKPIMVSPALGFITEKPTSKMLNAYAYYNSKSRIQRAKEKIAKFPEAIGSGIQTAKEKIVTTFSPNYVKGNLRLGSRMRLLKGAETEVPAGYEKVQFAWPTLKQDKDLTEQERDLTKMKEAKAPYQVTTKNLDIKSVAVFEKKPEVYKKEVEEREKKEKRETLAAEVARVPARTLEIKRLSEAVDREERQKRKEEMEYGPEEQKFQSKLREAKKEELQKLKKKEGKTEEEKASKEDISKMFKEQKETKAEEKRMERIQAQETKEQQKAEREIRTAEMETEKAGRAERKAEIDRMASQIREERQSKQEMKTAAVEERKAEKAEKSSLVSEALSTLESMPAEVKESMKGEE